MAYFRSLPNVKVRIKSTRNNNVEPYVVAKNIFRRIKLVDEIQGNVLGFEQYTIGNDVKPYQVANNVYGNSQYDWIIMLCNNITNCYKEWPMSEHELYTYVQKKYNGDVTQVHHYETNEVKTDKGETILEKGIQVNSEFRYYNSDGTIVPNVTYPVSNFEYERTENDKKANIWLLRKGYVADFVSEYRNLVKYAPNDEVGDDDVKMTWKAVEEVFNTKKDTYTTRYGAVPTIQFASSQELVNRTVTVETTESGAQIRTVDTTNTGQNSSGVTAGTTDSSSTQSGSSY